MEYYKSNAIYDYLISKKINKYRFVVGNAWQLVYGNGNCEPLLLVYAVGVPVKHLESKPSENEEEGYKLLNETANKAKLPIIYLRFACDVESITQVVVSNSTFQYSIIPIEILYEEFAKYGLPTSVSSTNKYLNDKTSSAYHDWQRKNLGANITVTDIDLWKLDMSSNPEIIIELKRSYYDLERWKPFTDDYRNFRLISNLCNMSNLGFKILYNQRIKTPFQDKIDKMKLFEVDFSTNPSIKENGIITLLQFESL